MLHKLLKSKIHRATVSAVEPDYVGSLAIDRELMDAAGILPGECILVANCDNGSRHWTYAIPAQRRGTICVKGAATHLVGVGHKVIIMCFGYYSPEETQQLQPKILQVDEANRLVRRL